jgi:histone-lysine N-methyltransferase SETD3
MEAAQTDGRLARRPLQDMNKEIEAHKILSSLFIQLIEERNATIMVNIQRLDLFYCLLLVIG